MASGSGAAFLFDLKKGRMMARVLRQNDPTAGAFFGSSVAIVASRALIGAPSGYNSAGSTKTGAAYVFSVAGGTQLLKLSPSDGGSGDEFGHSVALDGERAVIGARSHAVSGLASAGAVYIFDCTTGVKLKKLVAADASPNALFGQSVAMHQTAVGERRILVGASRSDPGAIDAGSVYLFNGETGAQLVNLVSPNPTLGGRFGEAVSIGTGTAGESVLIVGATKEDVGGRVYEYSAASAAEGQPTATHTPTLPGGFFGEAVGIGAGNVLVGGILFRGREHLCPVRSLSSHPSVLSATAFESLFAIAPYALSENGAESGLGTIFPTGNRAAERQLWSVDGSPGDRFGSSVAISSDGSVFVVGAPNHVHPSSSIVGGAFIFRHSPNSSFSLAAALSDSAPQYPPPPAAPPVAGPQTELIGLITGVVVGVICALLFGGLLFITLKRTRPGGPRIISVGIGTDPGRRRRPNESTTASSSAQQWYFERDPADGKMKVRVLPPPGQERRAAW